MEPDVIRLYSSSPPPLDEGAEEEDDEFGDFDGFGGAMASSFSFSEFDMPATPFDQSQVSDTSPPELPVGPSAPGPGKVSAVDRTTSTDLPKQPADTTQDKLDQDPTGSGVSGSRTEPYGLYVNGDVAAPGPLANGFSETDAQDASLDTTASALSSSSPCVNLQSEDNNNIDTSQHKATSEAGTSLANGFTKLHMHTEQEHAIDASATVAQEGQEESPLEEDSTPRHQGMSEGQQNPVDSGLYPEASETERQTQSLVSGGTPSPGGDSQNRDVLPEVQDLESDVHSAADQDLPTSPRPMRSSMSDNEVASSDDQDEFGDFGNFSSIAPDTTADGPPPSSDPEDECFGSFGECAATPSTQGFADFSQNESGAEEGGFASFPTHFPTSSDEPLKADTRQTLPHLDRENSGDNEVAVEGSSQDGQFGDLPVSDSFADFQSVSVGGEAGAGADAGEEWAAFGAPPADDQGGTGGNGDGDSWAAFGEDQTTTTTITSPPELEEPEWLDGAPVTASTHGSPHTSRRDSLTASLSSKLQRLFQASFPPVEAPQVGEDIPSLKALLVPREPDARQEQSSNQPPSSAQREPQDMWWHLQDIHSALGLKFLWGGSHSNRQLLSCLAMDTRNIVFSGQKKRPVLVPAYAAGLGMLEPTKDTVKASSAAGPVAVSAQAPPGAPDTGSTSKPTQEALSSVQPDWSSSGLKPPADGSAPLQPQSLSAPELNLDFFGPVEDSSSGSSTPPAGVDPELYELTTVPLETNNAGKPAADAFTRLMSTIEQNSTSTRKPVKDEYLSEEAARVLSGLPDLSFMRAKVLMFPSVLVPQSPESPS